jgi:hypothetical protein
MAGSMRLGTDPPGDAEEPFKRRSFTRSKTLDVLLLAGATDFELASLP